MWSLIYSYVSNSALTTYAAEKGKNVIRNFKGQLVYEV